MSGAWPPGPNLRGPPGLLATPPAGPSLRRVASPLEGISANDDADARLGVFQGWIVPVPLALTLVGTPSREGLPPMDDHRAAGKISLLSIVSICCIALSRRCPSLRRSRYWRTSSRQLGAALGGRRWPRLPGEVWGSCDEGSWAGSKAERSLAAVGAGAGSRLRGCHFTDDVRRTGNWSDSKACAPTIAMIRACSHPWVLSSSGLQPTPC